MQCTPRTFTLHVLHCLLLEGPQCLQFVDFDMSAPFLFLNYFLFTITLTPISVKIHPNIQNLWFIGS